MHSTDLIEIWSLFSEYIDKKHIAVVAEKFVDLAADLGVPDAELKEMLGQDHALDDAIEYYLDIEKDHEEDEDWDN